MNVNLLPPHLLALLDDEINRLDGVGSFIDTNECTVRAILQRVAVASFVAGELSANASRHAQREQRVKNIIESRIRKGKL